MKLTKIYYPLASGLTLLTRMPQGNANMDGLTKPQVKISKLEVGKYLFRLTVIGHNNELATTVSTTTS